MRIPSASGSSHVHLTSGDHTDGALAAWAGSPVLSAGQLQVVSALSPVIEGANDQLRTAVQSSDQANRKARKARARFGVCDVVLDMRLMAASDVLLNGPAMRSREHPIFVQVFGGKTGSEITAAKMRDEPELVSRVLEQYKLVEDFSGKASAVQNLEDALNASLSARSALMDAEQGEQSAFDAEKNARLNVRTVLEQAYGQLRSVFTGQRDFVESFFVKVRAEKGEKEDAEGGSDTASGSGPGGSPSASTAEGGTSSSPA